MILHNADHEKLSIYQSNPKIMDLFFYEMKLVRSIIHTQQYRKCSSVYFIKHILANFGMEAT
jgi:hypothetical protein